MQPGETPLATAGLGQLYTIDELPVASGVSTEQAVDLPAAYIELLSKDAADNGKSRGLFLASLLTPDALKAGDKPYEMALRFKRIPKPYQVTLLDFKHDRYIGSDTAKNFESDRAISRPRPEREFHGRDSHEQSAALRRRHALPGRLVPRNRRRHDLAGGDQQRLDGSVCGVRDRCHGDADPLRPRDSAVCARREEETRRAFASAGVAPGDASNRGDTSSPPWWRRAEYLVPALIVLAAATMTYQSASPVVEKRLDMHLAEFGRLPVVNGGRTQPMDSLARNTLRVISGKATWVDGRKQRQPAIRWFLDVVSRAPAFRDAARVSHRRPGSAADARTEHRPGNWRYSLSEIYHDVTDADDGELERQVRLAAAVPEHDRSRMQQKFLRCIPRSTGC